MGRSSSTTIQPSPVVVRQAPAPPPDPTLVAQQAQAVLLQQQATQQNVSTDSQNLLRQFGAQASLAGANLTTPLSSIMGGFASPAVSQSGALKGAS